jgi:hypothetical protein
MAGGWLNEKEPKHVTTIDTTLNKIVVLDGNFVYNLLRYLYNTTGWNTSLMGNWMQISWRKAQSPYCSLKRAAASLKC